MKNETKHNPNIFGCKTVELLPCIIFWTILLIYFLPGGISFLKSLPLPGNIGNIKYFLFFVFSIIVDILSILAYIANKKSYIELSDTHLILRKPEIYPFFKVKTINIPYEKIESINQTFSGFYNYFGYCIVIIKKVGYDQDGVIKFFGLNDGVMFLNKVNEKILEHTPQDTIQDDEEGDTWDEEKYIKEVYGEKLYDYKIYKRSPNRFNRIIFIVLAIISLITIAGIPLSIILILLIVGDVRKCNSYIEFTNSHVIIHDCQGTIFTKKIFLEISYYEISEIKYFEYCGNIMDDTGSNFNIYFNNNGKIKSFTVEKSGNYVDTYLMKYILANKKVKIDIQLKG